MRNTIIVALEQMVSATAMPQPSASICNTATKMISSTTLTRQPKAMITAGPRVSPTARSSAVPILSSSAATIAAK